MIEIFKYYIPSRDFQFPKKPFGYRATVFFGKFACSCCFLSYKDALKFGEKKLDFLKKNSNI